MGYTEDNIRVNMKTQTLVLVTCLLLAVNCSPQGFREKLRERLLKNSPCGEGVKPLACKCKSGSEFTLGEGRPVCRPKDFESCTCPDGETVEVDLEAAGEKLKEKLLAKSPCGAGIKPAECTCANGDTFTPVSSSGRRNRNPCVGPPSSCTCPDGETISGDTIKDLIKTLGD